MLQLSFVWWVSDLLLVHDYMLVKVGIRLEIQVVQLQIMEKQIFKSCTFTLSGPSGVGIGNSWGGGYFTIRYLVQLILWMLQLYYERTLILTIALLILLVHLQVNKNLHIYYAASS